MGILTKSSLFEFRNSTRTFSKSINESLEEFSRETKVGKITVFLSHKHDELRELDSAVTFLRKHGVNIYVDWLDGGMPKYTSGKTAVRIKEKIRENNKFILLATEASINSKWCNWELGFGDSLKYLGNIAILPVKDDNREFTGNEYLQIYPRIEEFTISNKNEYFVFYPDGSAEMLSIWLNKK
jgi:hypothetical protein